jgi:hypothetical protein
MCNPVTPSTTCASGFYCPGSTAIPCTRGNYCISGSTAVTSCSNY